MATQTLRLNETLTLDVTVGTPNRFSDEVHIKMEHNFGHGNVQGTNEAFLSPSQLDLLGRFLIRQAEDIRLEQESIGISHSHSV